MFARTERLTLRPGWPEDAAALAAAMGHDCVGGRLARVPWPYTVDHAAAWLSQQDTADQPQALIFAHEGDRPALVGGIGLTRIDGDHELGYWLTPAAWGRGYATEAARAMLDHARHGLGVHRVLASHHCDNPASGRVLAKLGFRPIGRAPRHSLARGHAVPSVQLACEFAGQDDGRTRFALAA